MDLYNLKMTNHLPSPDTKWKKYNEIQIKNKIDSTNRKRKNHRTSPYEKIKSQRLNYSSGQPSPWIATSKICG